MHFKTLEICNDVFQRRSVSGSRVPVCMVRFFSAELGEICQQNLLSDATHLSRKRKLVHRVRNTSGCICLVVRRVSPLYEMSDALMKSKTVGKGGMYLMDAYYHACFVNVTAYNVLFVRQLRCLWQQFIYTPEGSRSRGGRLSAFRRPPGCTVSNHHLTPPDP